MVAFLGFAPDLDPTTPGVITDCTNLVPSLKGYKGGPAGADVGMDALAAAALAAAVMTKLDASNRLIAGTATKLYEKSGTAWTDVSRATAYAASASFPWRFAQFGDTSLAVNKGDTLQYSNSGAFDDVTGAPKANVVCVVNGFVMVGDTNEATYGDSPDRWWCSALNDYTDWTPAAATQCTTGRLVKTPGNIRAMKPLGDDVIVYKESSMYWGRYVAPDPGVWDFTLIPGEIGCSSHEAVADIGTAHIFIGYEDFYIYRAGGMPEPIGSPLREWFFADLDPTYRYRIRHIHDRNNALIYWFYPRESGSGGTLDGCIVYNYKSDKWGLAHRTIESAVEYITSGYTWDSLPLTTWDSWPSVAYDSPFWTASSRVTAYIGSDHKIYSLTGVSASASLTTGDYGEENTSTLLTRATLRYLQIPTTASMTNYYQTIHGDSWTTDQTTTESSGRFDVFRSAPWHRAKFDFTGDFEVTGVNADMQPDGIV